VLTAVKDGQEKSENATAYENQHQQSSSEMTAEKACAKKDPELTKDLKNVCHLTRNKGPK